MPNYVSNNPGALSARRYLDINSASLAKFQNQLSSGSLISDPTNNPASAAIGILIQSDLQTIAQASSNAIQASSLIQLGVGALSGTNETLTRMQVLAAQANSSTMGDAERKMFMAEYQSLLAQINNNAAIEWRSTPLFNGGDGLATPSAIKGVYDTSVAANNSGTAFTLPNGTANNVGSLYEIIGNISANTATASVVTGANVSFNVGSEEFLYDLASANNLATGSIVSFTSTTDASKIIRFTIENAITNDATGAACLSGGINDALANINLSQNTTGLTRVSNWFTGGINLSQSQGLYTGSATNAISVQELGASTYDVRVTIGKQLFRCAAAAAPTAGGSLTLVSEVDPNNKISFNYDLQNVISTPSKEDFTSALQTLLGIGASESSSVSTFTSMSTAAYPGMSIDVGDAAVSAIYGLTYSVSGTTGTFTLSDGMNAPLTRTLNTTTAGDASNIDFGNGIKLNITDIAAFAPTLNKGFSTFSVENGVTMSFQIGIKAANTLSVHFDSADTGALNLDGTSVLTVSQAGEASAKISAAISKINLQIAQLGGKKSQLDFIYKNLDISSQNLIAAKATFTDTDIPTALMETQKYQALIDISSSMLQQTMEKDQKLAQLVQRATS